MLFENESSSEGIKWRLIGRGGKLLIDALFAACPVRIRGRKTVEEILSSRRYILAFWHSRILLVSYAHKGLKGAALVSNSADGEIIAQVLQRQGHRIIRGSTGKGGVRAMTRLIKEMRTHQCPGCVVPDGPQGPAFKVQPGIMMLARKTGYPIIPVTFSAKRCKVFNSWDRFIVPYPVSPCLLQYGRPLTIPSDSTPQQILAGQNALEKELMRITIEADRYFGHRFTP